MTDEENKETDATPESDKPPPIAGWLRSSLADLAGLDFEQPIGGSLAAECSEFCDQYHAATKPPGDAVPEDTPSIRIFATLAAVTGMHFKPADPQEPFGPMSVLADGRRTSIASDFRAAHIDVLAHMAERAKNPVLRARLADVCWLLDRKRGNLGSLAVSAYVETVQKIDRGELKLGFAETTGALHHEASEYLRRALQIGRAIGWDKGETIAARELSASLRKRAAKSGELATVLWFSALDLDTGISDAAEVGADLDEALANPPADASVHLVVEIWRLAARAYQYAKRDTDKHRCQSAAAECWVLEAQNAITKRGGAMLAAQALSTAIAALHGVPEKKERRTELRHQLVDVQAHIPDEMSSFSYPLDLREIAEGTQKAIEKYGLIDKLFAFASLAISPKPEQLIREASEAIRQHPLATIFATSHLDHEGKTIHRSAGAGIGDDDNQSAIQRQIAQSETLRRQLIAHGQVQAARQAIIDRYYVSDDIFRALLQYSGFVPPELVATFSRGFARFFQGDFLSATYILTPLLENSLRYVLKSHGHDVTIFDDATQTQEDRTISALFVQMRTELDAVFTKAITTDIDNVFLNKTGPHLRHSLAHGLLLDGGPYGADAVYGCALMFRLCLLPLFPYREQFKFPFD